MPVLDNKASSVDILGCPITNADLDHFVSAAEAFIRSRAPHYIAVVNVAKLIKMRSDFDLRESVCSADIVGADGVPLVWASRLLGNPLPGRVNGTDLMYRLLEKAAERNYRVFFFGATEDVLNGVLYVVRKDYGGLQIAGFRHGYFTPAEEPAIVEQIKNARADIIFIAFGTPKIELWVKRYLAQMGVPVVHGVGGSFDVLAGAIPRAPLWMQENGLEWLFRLGQEPRRMWHRYLMTNTAFVILLFKEWFCYRLSLLTPRLKSR
jgi:N-acetylglucosaminyldiphosphoundecaprenol N-acetyl-beta-D-mannosaminyltransferase